jgi:hypothetical protein
MWNIRSTTQLRFINTPPIKFFIRIETRSLNTSCNKIVLITMCLIWRILFSMCNVYSYMTDAW